MNKEPKLDAAKSPNGLRAMADGMIYLAGQTGVETANVWKTADILRAAADEMEELKKKCDEARSELERERMRLAACGVLAGCNTEDSLSKNLSMHPDYMSSSAQCVANAMCREIAIRARAERSEKERDEAREALTKIADLCQLTCVTFEQQSFRATRIAREALAATKPTTFALGELVQSQRELQDAIRERDEARETLAKICEKATSGYLQTEHRSVLMEISDIAREEAAK